MLQATDQLLHLVEVTGGPKEFLLCSFGLVLAARGTGGPRDLMKRRLHEGGKQHTPTGIPWGRLVALCCRALPGLKHKRLKNDNNNKNKKEKEKEQETEKEKREK